MRAVRGLSARLAEPELWDRVAAAATRGKRRRKDVAWFLFRREDVLARLRDEVASGSWRPTGFELLRVRDPKPRLIARAALEDRLVQAALVEVLWPSLERSLRPESMACRPGLGTHRAVLRLLELMRRQRWVVHLDVRAYFPSIDVDLVRALLARRVRDAPYLALVDRVLDAGRGLYDDREGRAFAGLDADWPPPGRGLPIGAVTSQVFATHVVLNALDHYVTRQLRVGGYVRYVDDLFVFGRRRTDLVAWREAIGEWLERERGLRLKHPRARILSCEGHLDGLGSRITREGIAPRRRVWRRLRGHVRRAAEGRVPRETAERVVASYVGQILFGLP